MQVDLVMTCQTALVLAEADLPSRQDSWAQDMTAAGPQNGPTLTPETPISPRDHSLLWESNQECVHLLLSTLTRLTWALACQRALGEAMRRLTAAQHQAWMSGKAQVQHRLTIECRKIQTYDLHQTCPEKSQLRFCHMPSMRATW